MNIKLSVVLSCALICGVPVLAQGSHCADQPAIENSALPVAVDSSSGLYSIRLKGQPLAVGARVAAQVDHRWLRSSDYPRHQTVKSPFTDEFGDGTELAMTHTGLAGAPDLLCVLRLHSAPAFAEVEVRVRNVTDRALTVQAIRSFEAVGNPVLSLNGPDSAIRVLSDSFSDDRTSNQGLFLGALTSNRWLTVLRLHLKPGQRQISAYEADATGTTEIMKAFVLTAPGLHAAEPVELSLPLAPGDSLASERMMIGLGSDYHAQLKRYGDLVRQIHHARVTGPTPMGWWSWSAYYHGLNAGTALTNAEFL